MPRSPGRPFCIHCNNESHIARFARPLGHGQGRFLPTHALLQPGHRWLCYGGHESEDQTKVVHKSASKPSTKQTKRPFVCRAWLADSDSESEDEEDFLTFEDLVWSPEEIFENNEIDDEDWEKATMINYIPKDQFENASEY